MAWTKQGNLKGPRGVTWFTGTGAPSGSITGSQAGDLYLDLANGDIYLLS